MRVRIGSRHMQQRSAQPFQVILCLALYGISACHGAAQFEMLFVSGDSISRAFNAEDDPKSADRCSLTSLKDHLDLSWHSNTANPSGPCSQPDPVKSYTEYMQCARNSTTVPATFNVAQTGSKMVENVVEQVTEVSSRGPT